MEQFLLTLKLNIDEIELLRTLKTFPNIRSFTCGLISNQNPNEVIKEMQRLQLSKVSLEELIVENKSKLGEDTPILNIFRNLTKLTVNAYENPYRAENCDKFIQKLYSINF